MNAKKSNQKIGKLIVILMILFPVSMQAQDLTVKLQAFRIQEGQKKHLLGICNRADLQKEPYAEWFNPNYNNYTPDAKTINKIKSINLKDYSVKIFLATWCIDSHREIPRFLKVLDAIGIQTNAVSLIGLSIVDSLHKQSSTHEEQDENIYRVPTIIIYKKGVEVNRIVEYPVISLERDLLAILDNEPYLPNYKSYPYLIKWLNEGLLADENVSVAGLANQVKYLLRNETELNAFGYVLSKQVNAKQKEALKIFQMNYYLYPESFLACTSLAEALSEAGDHKQAVRLVKRATQFNKDPENVNYLFELYDKVRGK